jgi:hypothetical protein
VLVPDEPPEPLPVGLGPGADPRIIWFETRLPGATDRASRRPSAAATTSSSAARKRLT